MRKLIICKRSCYNRFTKMLQFPAAERNKDPIRQELQNYIPLGRTGNALEIACGNGAHITYFAQVFKNLVWQPSDVDEKLFNSVSAYIEHMNTPNVLQPIKIDVTTPPEQWKDAFGNMIAGSMDLMYNSNMIHISPWDTAVGLFRGAQYLLKSGGKLFLYGAYNIIIHVYQILNVSDITVHCLDSINPYLKPFAVHGNLYPESNVQFDRSLRKQDSRWGVRDIDDVGKLAAEAGMTLMQTVDMPANNKILVFQKNE